MIRHELIRDTKVNYQAIQIKNVISWICISFYTKFVKNGI